MKGMMRWFCVQLDQAQNIDTLVGPFTKRCIVKPSDMTKGARVPISPQSHVSDSYLLCCVHAWLGTNVGQHMKQSFAFDIPMVSRCTVSWFVKGRLPMSSGYPNCLLANEGYDAMVLCTIRPSTKHRYIGRTIYQTVHRETIGHD